MATDKLMNSSQGDDIISALEGIATAIPSINTTTEIPSSQVTAMTGYAKSTSATPGAITTSDTLNEAVGKLEKKVDNNTSSIGSLDNASVGLGNVTNNAQVKAISGTVTNGGIVTFSADGSTVADSAKTIETSLSDNNNKIPTSKAVRDNVADVAKLSTYSADTGTTFKTVSATDTITDAIEKVQNNTLYNKSNISINSIKSGITLAEGYSLISQSTLYKQGKHIFGTLVIKKASGNFSSTQETVLTLPEAPIAAKMCIAGFNTSEWGIVSIGYAFISTTAELAIKDSQSSNNNYCNVSLDYIIS